MILFILVLLVACQATPFSGSDSDGIHVEKSAQFAFAGWVKAVAFSKGGRALAVGGCQGPTAAGPPSSESCVHGLVQVWNVEGGRLEATLTFPRPVTALAVSPDGAQWVVGDAEGRLIASRAYSKTIPKPFHQKSEITALAFSPDGKWVVSGSLDPSYPLGFMDVMTGGVVKVGVRFDPVSALAFAPNGKELAVGMTKGQLVVWEFTSRSQPIPIAAGGRERYAITSVAFSSDAHLLAYGRKDGKVFVLDRVSGQVLAEFRAASAVNALAFSPSGRYLALGQDNGKVFLIEPGQAREIWSKRHLLPVSDLAYSPDGTALAVAAQNNVYLYRVDATVLERPMRFGENQDEKERITSRTALVPMAP